MKLVTATRNSLRVDPKYERNAPLVVEYSKKCHEQKLRRVSFGATTATNDKLVRNYTLRAVNLDGCLLSNIEKSGRRGNFAVVLYIYLWKFWQLFAKFVRSHGSHNSKFC